ncbi:MAG: hypothetical protein Q8Q87_03350, partial [Candidatus Omnitrophota bacterium]|nr:hypothetical protein [Candidatus Omnitrophota bacterium]
MRRQKKIKKARARPLLSGLKEAMFEKAAGLAVALIFVLMIFMLAKGFLYRSDYFRLKRVEIKETFLDQKSLISIKSRILSSYKAKSMFRLDLK